MDSHRRLIKTALVLLFLLPAMTPTDAPGQTTAGSAPEDRPVTATAAGTADKLQEAIAPYVAIGRRTYPEARTRFLAGLAPGRVFSVTVKLEDGQGRFEMVFLRVLMIDQKHAEVIGTIANKIECVHGYQFGQVLTLPESRVLDWTISNPDGTEEGNAVGKFLDTYRAE